MGLDNVAVEGRNLRWLIRQSLAQRDRDKAEVGQRGEIFPVLFI
jgi:hypothetical protein